MARRGAIENWPVASESETLVARGPGGPPPPERRRWFDDNLALGMLVLLLVLVVGALAAYWLTHRHHHRAAAPPARTVVVTKPAATTSPPATTTVVQVAKLSVPAFVGEPVANARATAAALGFRVATTPVTGAGKPAGTVVDQAPKPGTKLAKGGLVTLSVAKGAAPAATTAASTTTPTTTAAAQPKTATVPDVSGQNEQAAVQALAQAGILPSLVFVSSNDPEGTVEAQAKPSGTTVPYRSHVQINISSGQNPTAEHVPNVVGMTLQQAVSTMNAAHLKLIYVKLAVPRNQAGKIVQQSPIAGGEAPQNAQILVFLGVFKP
ncbi:MAG TPA: PASTA domain-containing protein [Gaiellaceae bacterium]|jgi:beta-lactam-binding protein with PASTA domain